MKLQHCHRCHCVIVAAPENRGAACADCAFKMTRTEREHMMADAPSVPFAMPYAAAVARYPAQTSSR
jgi:hypothetical protein